MKTIIDENYLFERDIQECEKEKIFINKKKWLEFTEKELNEYKEQVFLYFRKYGFPYFPVNIKWRRKEYKKLFKYDYTNCIDNTKKTIKQSMHGLSLCWSYHPYAFEIKCNNFRTVIETFNDDSSLKKVISKRIMRGDNMSNNGLRKAMKIYTGTQCVSGFRPTAAAAIYSLFCKKNDTVFDMSFGFGGRCLGAHLSGMKYYGVDPNKKAYIGLNKMIDDFNINAKVWCQGSESTNKLQNKSVDLCFTSPPYFNCEQYSNDPSQSFIKYPSKDEWVSGFIGNTIRECYRILRDGKNLILNIQNVKTYENLVDDVKKECLDNGFLFVDQWELLLSKINNTGYKSEPILIFQKG